MRGLVPTLMLTLLLPLPAAALASYEARLTDSEGQLFVATFSVSAGQVGAQEIWLEVFDFAATVNGTHYTNTYPTALNPMGSVAGYDTGGSLVTIETPIIHALGQDSMVNLRLLGDGTWIRDQCIPLPSCNPNFGLGSYELSLIVIPEPSTVLLLGVSLGTLAASRRSSVMTGGD